MEYITQDNADIGPYDDDVVMMMTWPIICGVERFVQYMAYRTGDNSWSADVETAEVVRECDKDVGVWVPNGYLASIVDQHFDKAKEEL